LNKLNCFENGLSVVLLIKRRRRLKSWGIGNCMKSNNNKKEEEGQFRKHRGKEKPVKGRRRTDPL